MPPKTRFRRSLRLLLAVSSLLTATATAWAQDDDAGPKFDSRGRQLKDTPEAAKDQKITLPEPKTYVAPDYPPEAKKQGVEADVILKLTIDENGRVTNAVVETPSGKPFDFESPAIRAGKKLTFEPARYADGRAFAAIIKYKFEFRIEEQEVDTPSLGVYSGQVLMQGAETPIAGAQVTITLPDGTTRGARTDADGRFSFSDLEPGSYPVTVTASGYTDIALAEDVEAGAELAATYRLSADLKGGIEIFTTGKKPPREVTLRTLEKREIDRIPGTNGDALRSLQSLPGVARPPGLAGVLLVRGSSPFDTVTFVDGIDVPLIYHFGGLSSVVPTELLSKIDFYPGNYSARYGRAMGGIVDVGIRSPKSDGYHGMAQIDLIDARFLFEGPVPNLENTTFAFAGRRSYIDAWLGPVLEAAGAGVTQAPRYYDYQAILEHKYDAGKLRGSFYGSDDRLEILIGEPQPGEPALSGNVGLVTAFLRGQVELEHRFADDSRLDTQLAFGRDALRFGLASLFFDLNVLGFYGRSEYTRNISKNTTMHAGMVIQAGEASVSARLPAFRGPGQPANQPFSTRQTKAIDVQSPFYRPAAYVEFELLPMDRWRIVPGLRLDYAKDTESWDVSPRFNTRFDIHQGFPRTTVKGGVGLFHQPPQFQEVSPPLGTPTIKSNLAIHYGLGVEQQITQQIEASVEGFYKQLDSLVTTQATDSDAFVSYANTGKGRIMGMEVLLRYNPDERFFGWLAYTLSRSTRQDRPDSDEYLVSWDQTHILTILGSYRFGGGWEAGARFRLVSGNLQTPSVCNFADQTCDPNRINSLYHAASGAYTPLSFGAFNAERLPVFHALDLRVDKKWDFGFWALSAYLDVQNVYNSQNVEGITYNFDFTSRQFITGLPILPSIGLRGEF
ncbi:MAG: TonB-dependent receptor [Myxococcales bacterium]|nr:TonB-dependent receptor [Myxococcales bacterium]